MHKGKKVMVYMIIMFYVLAIFSMISQQIMYRSTGGIENANKQLMQFLIRSIFEIILFLFLLKGKKWAKIILTILFAFGGIIGIPVAIVGIAITSNESAIFIFLIFFSLSLMLSLASFAFSVLLLFNRNIKDFFSNTK